jgi:tRNA-specific 2-thiouridylase
VINYFFHSYTLGQTPNPCVACNRHIKFDRLFHFIKALDGDCLATGHYARITQEPNGPYRLWRALDKSKDQSYVLYMLGQNHLSQTLFPLGDLPKSKTREIARALDLPNYAKPDSQDICFIPDGDYRGFLKNEAVKKGTSAGMERGPIRDSSGKVIGEHEGIAFYTIGQREGLGISAEKPLYVTRIDAPANTLVVGPAEETLAQKATVEDIKWVLGQPPRLPLKSLVQIRYKHQPVNATLRPRTPSGVSVDFESPLRAVTPGQSAVFYTKSDEVLGGGIIRS